MLSDGERGRVTIMAVFRIGLIQYMASESISRIGIECQTEYADFQGKIGLVTAAYDKQSGLTSTVNVRKSEVETLDELCSIEIEKVHLNVFICRSDND